MMMAEALREPLVREAVNLVLADRAARVAAIIRGGNQRGQLACPDAEAAAAALVATVRGYYAVAATAPAVIPVGSAAPCTLQMASGLLNPAKPWPSRSVP